MNYDRGWRFAWGGGETFWGCIPGRNGRKCSNFMQIRVLLLLGQRCPRCRKLSISKTRLVDLEQPVDDFSGFLPGSGCDSCPAPFPRSQQTPFQGLGNLPIQKKSVPRELPTNNMPAWRKHTNKPKHTSYLQLPEMSFFFFFSHDVCWR